MVHMKLEQNAVRIRFKTWSRKNLVNVKLGPYRISLDKGCSRIYSVRIKLGSEKLSGEIHKFVK